MMSVPWGKQSSITNKQTNKIKKKSRGLETFQVWFLQLLEPSILKSCPSVRPSVHSSSCRNVKGRLQRGPPNSLSEKKTSGGQSTCLSPLFPCRLPQLCTHIPLGSSELFWASTSSAFHISLCVNYDASVKTSLLTVSGLENGRRNKGNSNYMLLALINAHLLCLVF